MPGQEHLGSSGKRWAQVTDRELLADFRGRGTPEALEELIARHQGMVYAVCLRILKDHHAAEDAAQGTFLVLARKANRLRPETRLAAWLFVIARHAAGRLRDRLQRRAQEEREAVVMRNFGLPDPAAETEALREALDTALVALPEKYREVVALRCLQGRSQEETARELGCADSTVSSLLSRAMARLRRRLGAPGRQLSVALLLGLLSEPPGPLPPGFAAATRAVCLGQVPASSSALQAAQGAIRALDWARVQVAGLVCGASAAAVLFTVGGYLGWQGWPASVLQDGEVSRVAGAPGGQPAAGPTALNPFWLKSPGFQVDLSSDLWFKDPPAFLLEAAGSAPADPGLRLRNLPAQREICSDLVETQGRPIRVWVTGFPPLESLRAVAFEYGVELLDPQARRIAWMAHRGSGGGLAQVQARFGVGEEPAGELFPDRGLQELQILVGPEGQISFPARGPRERPAALGRAVATLVVRLYAKVDGTDGFCAWGIKRVVIQRLPAWPTRSVQ